MSDVKLQLNLTNSSTKVQNLVDALSNAINQGLFKPGDALPSVNEISKEHNLSRDTVFKAYQELKQRGLVDSTPAKGYHVIESLTKILLMLDVYSPFKDVLYNAFVKNLPKNYKVDLVFHFYNERVFEAVMFDSIGRYNYYVVMNFHTEIFHDVLKKIDSSKLLILDLGDFEKGNYAYVCQDFGKSVYNCLVSGLDLLKKYQNFVLYFPDESEHPRITIKYFKKFCKDNNLHFEIAKTIQSKEFKLGTAYFIIRQKDVVDVVKLCREKNLKVGAEIGLIAYNDNPMYEIIENGITVISTDFTEMGTKAAQFICTKQKVQEFIPTHLIRRGSL
ncbi:MAG: GntR family transcriptional regulator [Bacteroidota bacterium]|nr:GntR family transcriptional regulator [Bacteroidota bacterium]